MPRTSLVRTKRRLRSQARLEHSRPSIHSRALTGLVALRQIVLRNITPGWIVSLVFLIPVFVYVLSEATKDVLIIDPFPVPKGFEESGITPEVMANRIVDEIKSIYINAQTQLRRNKLEPLHNAEPLVDADIPGTKIGIKTLIDLTRAIFRIYPKHAKGEVLIPFELTGQRPSQGEVVITIYIFEGRKSNPARSSRFGVKDLTENVPAELSRHANEAPTLILIAHRAAEMILEQTDPYALGVYKCDLGQYEEAIGLAKGITEDHDSQGQSKYRQRAFMLWGNSLLGKGKFDEAIQIYQKAIDEDPGWALPYDGFGQALQGELKFMSAIEMHKRAIEFDKNFDAAFVNWGDALEHLGRYDEAIEKYRRAVDLHPSVIVLNDLGVALHNAGKNEEAIDQLRKAIKLNPSFPAAYTNLGYVLQAIGQPQEAIENFKKTTVLDPKDPSAYIGWGKVLDATGKEKEANQMFKIASTLPNYESAKREPLRIY